MDTYCKKKFLLNIIEQYRIQSYAVFLENLRELLRLNNLPSTPLHPIHCLDRDNKSINCNSGKCYAHESPFTTNIRQGCALRNFDFPSPLFITIPNVNIWVEFFFSFECYWPLCNNKSLVYDIGNLIKTNIYSSLTTTVTSRAVYTNKPLKLRLTQYTDMDLDTNNATLPNHYNFISLTFIFTYFLLFKII